MPLLDRLPGLSASPIIRFYSLLLAAASGAVLLAGCGSSAANATKVEVPDDLPDICQDLDFNRDVEFRDLCGVKNRDYMAYRNIPEHRNLLQPKGGRVVKKGKNLELRLPNTLPTALPAEAAGKFVFDEKLRRTFIRSRMDYCEFFPEEATQSVKTFRLDIPQDVGGDLTVCFTVESRTGTTQRKTGYASRLEPLTCEDFQKLKARSLAQQAPADSTAAPGEPGATEQAAPQGNAPATPASN